MSGMHLIRIANLTREVGKGGGGECGGGGGEYERTGCQFTILCGMLPRAAVMRHE